MVVSAGKNEKFREFVLFMQNGIRLVDEKGNLIQTAVGEEEPEEPVEHEDPSTPVLEAYPGEKVIIRLLMPADKPRNTSFTIHGHEWMAQPEDILTRIISTQGTISVGNVFNIELLNGASMIPGDYLYRSSIVKWDIESGMWGILRIKYDKDYE